MDNEDYIDYERVWSNLKLFAGWGLIVFTLCGLLSCGADDLVMLPSMAQH